MLITFRSCPLGFSYTAPNTYEVPEKLAKKFIVDGVASVSTPVLPKDFPSREKLIESGFETIDDIKDGMNELKDLLDASELSAVKKAIK